MKRLALFAFIALICATCGCWGGGNNTATQNASATTSLAPTAPNSAPMAATVSDSPTSSVTMPTGDTPVTIASTTEAPATPDAKIETIASATN